MSPRDIGFDGPENWDRLTNVIRWVQENPVELKRLKMKDTEAFTAAIGEQGVALTEADLEVCVQELSDLFHLLKDKGVWWGPIDPLSEPWRHILPPKHP